MEDCCLLLNPPCSAFLLTLSVLSLASQPYFSAWVARMRVKYCRGVKLLVIVSQHISLHDCSFTVTGGANFNMELTSLTVGGFTQPHKLVEIPEKGLSQQTEETC